MRSLTLAAAACLALSLAGCVTTSPTQYGPNRPPPVTTTPSGPPVSPLARSITYTCEEQSTVTLTEGQPQARVMLNSGLELGLQRLGGIGGFTGTRYGAPPYEFRVSGDEGLLIIDQRRTFRCRAK